MLGSPSLRVETDTYTGSPRSLALNVGVKNGRERAELPA
jgi:hypothetical protein